MLLPIVLLAAAMAGAIHYFITRPIEQPAGVLVTEAPKQRSLTNAPTFTYRNYTLTPRADFALTARVLSGERYKIDNLATLVPRDLALGWGIMSDSALIEKLNISQSGRFFFWRFEGEEMRAQIPQIVASSANMHVIPANAQVKDVIDSVRVGELISIEGKLVDVARGDGWAIKTSLSRDDSGPGACEIVYVEAATVVRPARAQKAELPAKQHKLLRRK
jgi:hypothetical protein